MEAGILVANISSTCAYKLKDSLQSSNSEQEFGAITLNNSR